MYMCIYACTCTSVHSMGMHKIATTPLPSQHAHRLPHLPVPHVQKAQGKPGLLPDFSCECVPLSTRSTAPVV